MNYSYTLIIHYSLKNFLIVDNYDISVYNISGGGGEVSIPKIKSHT